MLPMRRLPFVQVSCTHQQRQSLSLFLQVPSRNLWQRSLETVKRPQKKSRSSWIKASEELMTCLTTETVGRWCPKSWRRSKSWSTRSSARPSTPTSLLVRRPKKLVSSATQLWRSRSRPPLCKSKLEWKKWLKKDSNKFPKRSHRWSETSCANN